VRVDRSGAEFIRNKQNHSLTHKQTYIHSTLYISIQTSDRDVRAQQTHHRSAGEW